MYIEVKVNPSDVMNELIENMTANELVRIFLKNEAWLKDNISASARHDMKIFVAKL